VSLVFPCTFSLKLLCYISLCVDFVCSFGRIETSLTFLYGLVDNVIILNYLYIHRFICFKLKCSWYSVHQAMSNPYIPIINMIIPLKFSPYNYIKTYLCLKTDISINWMVQTFCKWPDFGSTRTMYKYKPNK
jgi:hypothetical protein